MPQTLAVARDLITAEHHRQRTRHAHWLHLGHQIATVERDVEEELEATSQEVVEQSGMA